MSAWFEHPFAWPDRHFYHSDPGRYGSLHPVSMEAWFGSYSARRLLTVAKVVLRLLGRFQDGGHWRSVYLFAEPNLIGRSWTEPSGKYQLHLTLPWLTDNRFEQAWDLMHEMMHYLVREYGWGRPYDCDAQPCSSDNLFPSLWTCYGDANALLLAPHDPDRAVMNIDNYRGWIYWRYYRWDGGWPPSVDADDALLGLWDPDPIADEEWEQHPINPLPNDDSPLHSWTQAAADAWYHTFAMNLGEPGFNPWA